MSPYVDPKVQREKEEAQDEIMTFIFYGGLGLGALAAGAMLLTWLAKIPWWGWLLIAPVIVAVAFLVVAWWRGAKRIAAQRMQPSAIWWATVEFEQSPGQSKIRPVILAEVRATKVDVYYITSQNKDHEPAHFVRADDLVEDGVANWVEFDRVRTIKVEALHEFVKHLNPTDFVMLQQQRVRSTERRRGAA